MVIHELGHYLGMHHVCLPNQTIAFVESDMNTCSTVGTGPAIMNTGVERDQEQETMDQSFDSAGTLILPLDLVMPLDIKEFKRVWQLRH
jgi:hypothetical protein